MSEQQENQQGIAEWQYHEQMLATDKDYQKWVEKQEQQTRKQMENEDAPF